MKIIFLDIDGVLNSIDNLKSLSVQNGIDRDGYGFFFDERCVRWLSFIIEKTGAKIVISSSWRLSGLSTMLTMWMKRSLPGEIIGITPNLPNKERGNEIRMYLTGAGAESFVILDDDTDLVLQGYSEFVKLDSEYGLTSESAHRAIKILRT